MLYLTMFSVMESDLVRLRAVTVTTRQDKAEN